MNSSQLPRESATRVGRGAPGPAVVPRASVAIGFGSPSQDSGVGRLDLNDVLIRNPLATFLMRVSGSAMREAGIDDGDIVLVDRSVRPASGHIVIAVVDDEFMCRRLVTQGSSLRLVATDQSCADVVPRAAQELQVWGVVTNAIKAMPV